MITASKAKPERASSPTLMPYEWQGPRHSGHHHCLFPIKDSFRMNNIRACVPSFIFPLPSCMPSTQSLLSEGKATFHVTLKESPTLQQITAFASYFPMLASNCITNWFSFTCMSLMASKMVHFTVWPRLPSWLTTEAAVPTFRTWRCKDAHVVHSEGEKKTRA